MPLDVSVLVASGDPDVADELIRRLLQLGCHALGVSRHAQALDATDAREFHLALVTEDLEDDRGLNVVAALRRKHPRLAVYYLVAAAVDERLSHEARGCGATRCVARPVSRVAVEAWLEDALEASCPLPGTRSSPCAVVPAGPSATDR